MLLGAPGERRAGRADRRAPFEVPAQTIAEGEESAFPLPPALASCR